MLKFVGTKLFIRIKANFGILKIRSRQIILYLEQHYFSTALVSGTTLFLYYIGVWNSTISVSHGYLEQHCFSTALVSGTTLFLCHMGIWNNTASLLYWYLEQHYFSTTLISGTTLFPYCIGIWNNTISVSHGYLEQHCFSTALVSGTTLFLYDIGIWNNTTVIREYLAHNLFNTCSPKIPPLTLKIRHKVEVNTFSWNKVHMILTSMLNTFV